MQEGNATMTKPTQCAATDCKASAPHINTVDASAIGMPAEILARSVGARALRCQYCGFVWFEGSPRVPAGFYDAPMMHKGFVSVPLTHPTR